MDRHGHVRPLCVVFLSGELPAAADQIAEEALNARGFELFTLRPLEGSAAKLAPVGFDLGSRALIAYNVLITPASAHRDRVFADFEVEKAAHLLVNELEQATKRLRVTVDCEQAEALAAGLLSPDDIVRLDADIAERRAEMTNDLPVLADLSRFKYRAKVELVSWQGQTAVKKTFRRTGLDAMARELAFLDDIAPHSPVPPRVLERTRNAIVFEHIENTLKTRRLLGFRLPIPLSLPHVRELADFVHLVTERGWDPIDLTPRDNVLIDGRTGRLRAIDFEFAHHSKTPVAPETSYFLAGVPADATVARPLNQAMELDPYPGKWRYFTGLSKRTFLKGPSWLQRIERMLVHPPWLAVRIGGALLRRRRHAARRDALLAAVAMREPSRITEDCRPPA